MNPQTVEQQCEELIHTVKCRLAPSKIHGVGVVTIRDIKKGERAFCIPHAPPTLHNVSFTYLQKHLKDHQDILQLILDRWPHVVNGEPFLNPNNDARLLSFMNHGGDESNYNPKTDRALVDIKAGEEVLEDYRIVKNYERAYPFLVV